MSSPNYREVGYHLSRAYQTKYTFDQFEELAAAIRQDSLEQQHFGVIGIRMLASTLVDMLIQIIDAIINSGTLPRLIDYARQNGWMQLKF